MLKSKLLIVAIAFGLMFSGCNKEREIVKETVVDNTIYDVGGEAIYQSNAEKTKQKSNNQFISILFSNLFQTSISSNSLSSLGNLRQANGDKQMIDELYINSFVNEVDVIIPTEAEMRADVETFVKNTYLRFYLREASPYEVLFVKEMIDNDPDLTPELVYTAFATSNEYKFY